MRLKMANKPLHGESKGRQMAPLKAGAHMPMRNHSGASDAKGYKGGAVRRNGEHTGGLLGGDTRRKSGPEGNSKGSPPPALNSRPGVAGTLDSHLGTAGRGGTGRIGKHDSYHGKPTKYSEDISHSAFEKLGST